MRTFQLNVVVGATCFALAILAAKPATACGGNGETAATWQPLSVAQLSAGLSQKQPFAIYDVNSDKTRQVYGMIPGARALSSTQYQPTEELPPNKDALLVFYCANTRCTASHQAADRAIDAGYHHVFVLTEGIAGWLNAGQQVATPVGQTKNI